MESETNKSRMVGKIRSKCRKSKRSRSLRAIQTLLFLSVAAFSAQTECGVRAVPRLRREVRRSLLNNWERRSLVAELKPKFGMQQLSNLQIRVISLMRVHERATPTLQSLKQQNISFKVFNAVDGLDFFHRDDLRLFAGRKKLLRLQRLEHMTTEERHEIYRKYRTSALKSRVLRESLHEVLRFGCYLSHTSLWTEIVETGLPYLVILEDDVIIADNFESQVKTLVASLPVNWDLLQLNGCYRKLGPVFGSRLRLSRGGLCTYGYVISNAAAKALLNGAALHSNRPIDHVIDHEILLGHLEAFHAEPPLVWTQHVKSTLAYPR